MARPNQLQPGSLVPAAKPVDQFVNWRNVQAARPTELARMGQPSQVQSVGVGSLQNVQGRNSIEDLATALAPLTKLADLGLEMHASNEYKRGQNEVLKASALLNKQMLASGREYAAQNRDLSRVDPVAAAVMDRGNPYRVAGRKNQASQLAAQAMPGAMNQLWAQNAGDLVKLDPASPRLNEVRAQAIEKVNSQFGLTEMDAGFMDYVLPSLNRAWEQFGDKHLKARTAYLKNTQFRMASTQLYNEIIGWDGVTMSEDQLLTRLGAILGQNASELGIAGEPSEFERKTLVDLTQRLTMVASSESPLAGQARRLLGVVAKIPTGQLGPGGTPMLATELYGLDLLEGMEETAGITRRLRDRQLKDQEEGFDDKWGSQLATTVPGSSEANSVIDEAMADPDFSGLPLSRRRQILIESTKQGREFGEARVNETALQQQLEDWESRIGSDWDEAQARREFQSIVNQLPPGATDTRRKFRDQWDEIRRRKNQESKGSYNTSLINTNVKNAIQTQLVDRYPDIQEAAMQGIGSLEGLLAYGDSYRKAATQNMSSELRRRIYARLREESAKRGLTDLEPDVQQSVIDKVIKEVTTDQALMNRLMPPLKSQQSQGQQSQGSQGQQSGGRGASGPQPLPVQPKTFKPSTLDTVPEELLRGNSPVLSGPDTAQLLADAMNGKSLPAAFKRAARTVGMTPEQFLIRQSEAYPSLDLTPSQRQKLLKQGNQSKGLADGVKTASSAPPGGLTQFAGTLIDIMTGAAPAHARTPLTFRQQMAGQGPLIATASTPAAFKPLANIIGGVESFGGNYGAFNRGGSGGGHVAHSPGVDPNLTGMTIAQIQRRQLGRNVPSSQHLHAVGKYQIIGPTLRALMQGKYGPTGVKPTDKFTPEVQERLGMALARNRVVPGNLSATMRGLREEWIGLQNVSDAQLRAAALRLMRGN